MIDDAEITILVNGDEVENGGTATWDAGENTIVITVQNGDNTKEYSVDVTYLEEVEFTFDPEELTADDTYGLSSDTVTVDDGDGTYEITVGDATADNEHITVTVEGNVLTVECDDDSIFETGFDPITITVTGRRDANPATGTFQIVES